MSGGAGRCFLAIPLPGGVRAVLAEWAARARRAGVSGAWVRPENYHVTVRFLGDLTGEQAAALDAYLPGALSGRGPLRLRVAGADAFPNAGRPRVLWAGVSASAGDLGAVFAAGEAGARAIGLPPDHRPPHPHVTLLRLRRPAPANVIGPLLEAGAALETDAFDAGTVALWRSTRRPGGAVYEQRREYPLT